MRTTITMSVELAERLDQLRVASHKTWKETFDCVLRAGLAELEAVPTERAPYRTAPVDMGVPTVDLLRPHELLVQDDEQHWRRRR